MAIGEFSPRGVPTSTPFGATLRLRGTPAIGGDMRRMREAGSVMRRVKQGYGGVTVSKPPHPEPPIHLFFFLPKLAVVACGGVDCCE